MQWEELSQELSKIEETSLRNAKMSILAEIYSKLTPKEVKIVSYLVLGRVAPLYEPVEIGMAEKSILKVLSRISSTYPENTVAIMFKELGDLGEVTSKICIENKHEDVDITEVFEVLSSLTRMSGYGSQDKKASTLTSLIKKLSPLGAKYVVRLVSQKLRLGFSEMTILDSLSFAKNQSKVERPLLEQAYNALSDLGYVAASYMEGRDIADMQVVPSVPVRPMRAERLGTMKQIIEKLGECAVEPKLDGMRVQIHAYDHIDSDTDQEGQADLFEGLVEDAKVDVKIFSRGLEDITEMFPEVVDAAKKIYAKSGSFILDGEAIGINNDGSFAQFQETMKRKRKYGITDQAKNLPLKVFVFDVLYAQCMDRLKESYAKRRDLLSMILNKSGQDVIVATPMTIVRSDNQMQILFDEAMIKKQEGILVKKIDSRYRAGARDFAWVKYKRAHEVDMADTIDGVIMGAYVGKGKRQKFGVGAFLLGILDHERIVTVAKIGTGLSDEQFRELFLKIEQEKMDKKPDEYYVPKVLEPDIWVKPQIIVEIEADEITESPLHSATYALRFPRLVRFRDDKKVRDITSKDEVFSMYQLMRGGNE